MKSMHWLSCLDKAVKTDHGYTTVLPASRKMDVKSARLSLQRSNDQLRRAHEELS